MLPLPAENGDASPAIEEPAAAVESEGQFTTGENPKLVVPTRKTCAQMWEPGISSDILSGIPPDILADILCDISADILSEISFDILADILSDISPDVLSDILSIFLTFYLFSRLRSGKEHWAQMVAVAEARRRKKKKKKKKEKIVLSDIKSNNPHLKVGNQICVEGITLTNLTKDHVSCQVPGYCRNLKSHWSVLIVHLRRNLHDGFRHSSLPKYIFMTSNL